MQWDYFQGIGGKFREVEGEGEGGEEEDRLWEILKTVLLPPPEVRLSRESLSTVVADNCDSAEVVGSFTTSAKITVISPRTPPRKETLKERHFNTCKL